MDWKKFEFMCAEIFALQGWKVRTNKKQGADGGVDIWLSRRGEKSIVQCKRYKDTRVGVKIVREMFGLMKAHQCQSGFVVTTSKFTKECYRFAEGKEISLINGDDLEKIIRKFKG